MMTGWRGTVGPHARVLQIYPILLVCVIVMNKADPLDADVVYKIPPAVTAPEGDCLVHVKGYGITRIKDG